METIAIFLNLRRILNNIIKFETITTVEYHYHHLQVLYLKV